ncbi:MAG: DUF378 domain-containing protein [Candidatus Micrarchaeia archaeon]
MNIVVSIAQILCAIGAINWGLTVFNFNLVSWIDKMAGNTGILAMVIYLLVGLSGIVLLLSMLKVIKD